ncbi:MAG: ATP-NAD kinase family protein, partial [Candidatus Thorarchaeota archaeon]
ESMVEDGVYILGPGTTVRTVAQLLGVKKTTLGVDLYSKSGVKNDVNESEILESVKDFDSTWIVVSPIGRQGILFGRGNQQISPKIIERVGRDNILILSTAAKLRDIENETLKVDTGNSSVDEMLRGYIRVITDYNELRLVKVE